MTNKNAYAQSGVDVEAGYEVVEWKTAEVMYANSPTGKIR